MDDLKVCKFGGTSLSTRSQIEKCLDIMLTDKSRKYMVVSAPGSRTKGDVKVTDLLIRAAAEKRQNGASVSAGLVIDRFREIVPDDTPLVAHLAERLQAMLSNVQTDNYEEAVKAFGEYGSACVIDSILKAKGIASEMLDPLYLNFRIIGSGYGALPDPRCYRHMGKALKAKQTLDIAIIPGFYGYDKYGKLMTLPRGGSDTSGAVVARAARAAVYENWTDEDGLKKADPRVVEGAAPIVEMTYDEARELAYMGFKLQDACFEPIKGNGIVLNVRNTNNPTHPGTRIVDERDVPPDERIVGVACEEGFVSIGMRKMYIDKEVGFGRKMFGVVEKMNLPYEHTLDGVDTTSLVLAKKYLRENGAQDRVVESLKKACRPEAMMIREFALVSVAGIGIRNHYDVHARTFSALAREKVSVQMIDEGADDLSFFIGVDSNRSANAVRAIYREFFPG